MLVYFDTSAVMAILQKERGYRKVMELWAECKRPCSSILLNVEAIASVRRNLLSGPASAQAALDLRMSELRRMLDTMALFPVEEEVAGIVEKEKALSRCRSLDAIHLATALFIQRETGEPILVCTLDARMREAAGMLHFRVQPPT